MMTGKYIFGFLLAAIIVWPSTLAAQAYPVDDSASQVLEPGFLKMRWDSVLPKPGQVSTITGHVVVLVRLDVSPWRGRQVRIYQKLPSGQAGPIKASWTSNGPLLSGTLHDGERTLVYSGPINSDRLEDTFRLTIQADGERVERPQALAFSFEIELEPQS